MPALLGRYRRPGQNTRMSLVSDRAFAMGTTAAPGGHTASGISLPRWYRAGSLSIVRTTVDAAGRVVIPKPLRAALGIGPNAEVEIVQDGTGLRLEPVTTEKRPVDDGEGLPLLRLVPNLVLTDDDVRRLRDDSQR